MERLDTNNKTLYKLLVSIGLPITIQGIIQTILPMIDHVMIGQLGEDSIAALAAGNKSYTIFYFIMISITGATTVYVVQFWGNNKKDSIPKAFKIPLISSFIIFAIYIFISFEFPIQSVAIFGIKGDNLILSSKIQHIYALSALPVIFTNMYAVLLRATNRVKIPMIFGVISIFVNTILNYMFIFGVGIIEPMGVLGAVYATLLARMIEMISLTIYIILNKEISFNLIKILKSKVDKAFSKAYYKTMFPLLGLNLLFIFASTGYTIIYGNADVDYLVSISIMAPIESFSRGLFVGLSAASGIIIGTELGKKRINTAISYSRRILKIATFFTVIISVIIMLLSYSYVSLYKVSESIFYDSVLLIIISAVFLTVKVLNKIVCNGIIQTGGNTKYFLFLNIIGPWCIGIPMALLGARVFHFHIYVVYAMVTFEEAVRLALGLRKVFKNEWATNIVNDIDM